MKNYEVVIIGGGPAGLAAAIELGKCGAQVLVIDANLKAGGQLFKQIHKFFGSSVHRAGTRGIDIGEMMLQECKMLGVEIWLESVVIGVQPECIIATERKKEDGNKTMEIIQAKKIIIATGASENAIRFRGWTLPGVMTAGAAQTMINVNRVLPGEKILMIGSGNVGLIVSYQLLQAGADVVGIVEAQPKINGYTVHASKIVRTGVPLFISHTIIEARGDERVREAVIAQVDSSWNVIPESEQTIQCDTITLAAGLKPLIGIARMFGCQVIYDRLQGGNVPVHNRYMETTVPSVYVAGDVTGIEEANTAIEEGKLAGTAIAQALGYLKNVEAEAIKKSIWERLNSLREGPHGLERLNAKERQIAQYTYMKGVAESV